MVRLEDDGVHGELLEYLVEGGFNHAARSTRRWAVWMTDRPHEHASRKLAVAAGQLVKVSPYLTSSLLIIVGVLLAFYGLFDLGTHYQGQERATSRTSWVTECPRTGRAPPPSSRASRSPRSAYTR